jgi:protein-tyrosine phosphatase
LKPRYLEAAFAEIEKEYGSMDNYLRRGLGVDENFRRRLRERYLE